MNDNFKHIKQNEFLINWLTLIFILVLAMIVIGGITRITDSGLSMVEWRPFLGFLPPLGDQEWQRVFNLYKNTPEYSYYNKGMLLSEFKFIFFWEYFHRLWGRLIGIVFIIPFTYLIIRKKLDKCITFRLLIILFFGSLQYVAIPPCFRKNWCLRILLTQAPAQICLINFYIPVTT